MAYVVWLFTNVMPGFFDLAWRGIMDNASLFAVMTAHDVCRCGVAMELSLTDQSAIFRSALGNRSDLFFLLILGIRHK
jgi:hypothetical protein